jgi:hypothetical protein
LSCLITNLAITLNQPSTTQQMQWRNNWSLHRNHHLRTQTLHHNQPKPLTIKKEGSWNYSGETLVYFTQGWRNLCVFCLVIHKPPPNRYKHLYFEFMKFYNHVKLCTKTIKSYNYIISVINRFQYFPFCSHSLISVHFMNIHFYLTTSLRKRKH